MSSFSPHYRFLSSNEEAVLWPFLMLAAHETTCEAVQGHTQIALYVQDWGRTGDIGIVAQTVESDLVGAAWLRLWTDTERGFGWVNETTPELSLAVVPAWRDKGVGSELLRRLLAAADAQFAAVCLNVRENNPAVRLYERAGLKRVTGSEMVNRTGGISFIMVRTRPQRPLERHL